MGLPRAEAVSQSSTSTDTFPQPQTQHKRPRVAPTSTDEPFPFPSALLRTTGAMSRFQRVTLVHAVSRTRGVRCSPSPEMKGEGREVEICRNWSAKKRGATVVFSLPERKGDSGKQPRRCPAAGKEGGSELEGCQPWGGTRMLVTTGNKTRFRPSSAIPAPLPSHRTAQGVKAKPPQQLTATPLPSPVSPAAVPSVPPLHPGSHPAHRCGRCQVPLPDRAPWGRRGEPAPRLGPGRALTGPARRAAGRRRGRRVPR